MKPPFPYYGGKITLGPAIASLLPAHAHYVEPYAGSLAVLLAKDPSVHETVNDLDESIVNFWRILRERPDDLARVCSLTPHSRSEFEACADIDAAADDLERARRLWVRLTQGRAGRLRRAGWRHYVDPSGVSTGMPGYLDGYVDRMAAAVERLKNVSLECRPALEVIRTYGARPDVLLYVDPPYLGSTRSNDRSYRHELMGDDDHRELAEALHECKASVVLSGYPSDLYDRELYSGWDRHTMAASTYMTSARSARVEVLWSNRPIGMQGAFDFGELDGAA
ncbi:DNA adenine methylase [Micromonospora aurantiaca]|uniref:DNA adenine methylase n=1 Tax=Micromonospora aurantiaca (nom. illeg.) TaxID=47850 RepID=A0A6N3JX37_9ACTN|nr:DNA adenine methylase [Micromonospora aurantiaca]AXH89429.1 DNA adenine methylase [Micromonospora aurantiaca]